MAHRIVSESGCWLYEGHVGRNGYARIKNESGIGMSAVHRVAYEAFKGPIPEGLDVDHTCHKPTECNGKNACQHRRCFNPDHLEAVTTVVNISRGHGPYAALATARANKLARTHCKHGHEYTPENTRAAASNGSRVCKACAEIADEKRRAKERLERSVHVAD